MWWGLGAVSGAGVLARVAIPGSWTGHVATVPVSVVSIYCNNRSVCYSKVLFSMLLGHITVLFSDPMWEQSIPKYRGAGLLHWRVHRTDDGFPSPRPEQGSQEYSE